MPSGLPENYLDQKLADRLPMDGVMAILYPPVTLYVGDFSVIRIQQMIAEGYEPCDDPGYLRWPYSRPPGMLRPSIAAPSSCPAMAPRQPDPRSDA